MTETTQLGRLAMRVEGDWRAGYYAETSSMKGAIELARIRMVFVQEDAAKEIFLALMRDAVSDLIRARTGVAPSWDDPQPAPATERSGRA